MLRSSLTHRTIGALAALVGAAFIGCADAPPATIQAQGTPIDDPTKDIPEAEAPYSAGTDNTHDHFNDLGANGGRDPFDILAQRQEEGPPEIRTRLHSCQKLQVAAVRSLLASFGVNLDATGDPAPAGQLLQGGTGALGVANYDARVGETIVWSSAGAAKLFDIFVQAAPEVIANMEASPQCQLNGAGVKMFDDANQCNKDAISCLIGKPASADHVALCNNVVKSASSVDKGKNIAVASMLAAAFSCE
jgi:hypothetical protein